MKYNKEARLEPTPSMAIHPSVPRSTACASSELKTDWLF